MCLLSLILSQFDLIKLFITDITKLERLNESLPYYVVLVKRSQSNMRVSRYSYNKT